MTKVFKDSKRSGGCIRMRTPTAGTSGHVIDEVDKIVDHIIRGSDVFEQLLTTDEYFVYHNRPDEQSAVKRWKEAYKFSKASRGPRSPKR